MLRCCTGPHSQRVGQGDHNCGTAHLRRHQTLSGHLGARNANARSRSSEAAQTYLDRLASHACQSEKRLARSHRSPERYGDNGSFAGGDIEAGGAGSGISGAAAGVGEVHLGAGTADGTRCRTRGSSSFASEGLSFPYSSLTFREPGGTIQPPHSSALLTPRISRVFERALRRPRPLLPHFFLYPFRALAQLLRLPSTTHLRPSHTQDQARLTRRPAHSRAHRPR